MSNFTDPLDVRQINGHLWETLRDMTYYTQCDTTDMSVLLRDRCKVCIVIPSGFLTDFASIPSIVWPVIGHPAGEYAQAAVLHDFLYQNKTVSRKQADDIFKEAMGVLGVPKWKQFLIWAAVRSGGWMFYKKEFLQ